MTNKEMIKELEKDNEYLDHVIQFTADSADVAKLKQMKRNNCELIFEIKRNKASDIFTIIFDVILTLWLVAMVISIFI